ncbi:MAG: hypothetical protein Tp176DCM1853251_58 [Prokaryotic dsDNA virus sp.]|nr:MAG: hypothetical protein Tp176DCM1853251_58 [Prokaryotic dsDNA virus sp.]|tara:strand:- start:7709 stop:8104 length:396 start_codon:yes stop_codon:yes gene_type:complete
MAVEVEGLDDLNRRLNSMRKKAPQAVARAAFAAGLKIQGESQKRVPVEYGNLRASAYTQKIKLGAEVGYTSAYALFVHENMEQTLKGEPRPSGLGTYWNPGGPKFLESAVNENLTEITDLAEAYLAEALGL